MNPTAQFRRSFKAGHLYTTKHNKRDHAAWIDKSGWPRTCPHDHLHPDVVSFVLTNAEEALSSEIERWARSYEPGKPLPKPWHIIPEALNGD